jgi:hypothetical protein
MNGLTSLHLTTPEDWGGLILDENGWTIYHHAKPVRSFAHNIWGGGNLRVMQFKDFKEEASIVANSLRFTRDGTTALWWERASGKDGEWHVMKNGTPVAKEASAEFEPNDWPELSENGEHAAYVSYGKSADPDKYGPRSIVKDDQIYGPYANTWALALSKDGQHLAYAAMPADGKKWRYYKDGNFVSECESDSAFGPHLSKDGSHISWIEKTDDKKFAIVLDGKKVGAADRVITGPGFDEDGGLRWVAISGAQIVAVAIDPAH